MTPFVRTARRIALCAILALGTAACSSHPLQPRADVSLQVQSLGVENPILVMTQNGVPDAVMDAFFQGRIIVDAAGCLRLEDVQGATVVWPVNYTGEVTAQGVAILDQDGHEVGQVGGSFSFGGGNVSELLASLGFTQEARDLADALCPGDYWIVAP